MARSNFWNDVIGGAMNTQKMMNDSERAARENREFERKEKAWEQEDAVDSALANAPKEVTTVAPKYKVGDQEFSTLDEAAKTSALLNESAPGSATIQPADASGNAVSGWREAAKSDQYKDAVRTLQSKGYGLAADKVHAEYGKAVTQELKKAINKAAATGDWSETMSIYNNKVGDNFDGRMEKGADGKLHFYSKGKDGKEVLSNTFDNNADAAAYYSSIEDGKLHEYWKTNVVNKELAQQKLAQKERALIEAKRHNEMVEATRMAGGGGRGSGSSGSKSSDKSPTDWGFKEVGEAVDMYAPKGESTGITKLVDKKPVDVTRAEFVSGMHQAMNAMQGSMPVSDAAQLSYKIAQQRLSGAPMVDKDGKRAPYAIEPVFSNGKTSFVMNDDKGRVYQFGGNRVIGDSELASFEGGSNIIAAREKDKVEKKWGMFLNAEKSPENKVAMIKQYFGGDEGKYDKARAEALAATRKYGEFAGVDKAVENNQNQPDVVADDKTDKGTTTRAGKFFGDIADNYSKGYEAQRLRRENDPIRKKFAEHWDYLFKDQVPR